LTVACTFLRPRSHIARRAGRPWHGSARDWIRLAYSLSLLPIGCTLTVLAFLIADLPLADVKTRHRARALPSATAPGTPCPCRCRRKRPPHAPVRRRPRLRAARRR